MLADYDAPLTERGEYTAKYDKAAEMIANYDPLAGVLYKPERPPDSPPFAYFDVLFSDWLDFNGIVDNVVRTRTGGGQDRVEGLQS